MILTESCFCIFIEREEGQNAFFITTVIEEHALEKKTTALVIYLVAEVLNDKFGFCNKRIPRFLHTFKSHQ